MPGRTPYLGLRYPLESEVADPAALQLLATDINTALAASYSGSVTAARRSSATFTFNNGAVVKNTLTPMTLVVGSDNGANGPGATAYWSAGAPTQIRAPATGLYLTWGFVSAGVVPIATSTWSLASMTRNGANPQTAKNTDRTAAQQTGFVWAWPLTAGDVLVLSGQWNGTPAGPVNMGGTVGIALIALP